MVKPKIDIVLPWVDGSDPVWLDGFHLYTDRLSEGDRRPIRYRDWGLLRYWFRGIEKFMPWVGTIHFVTSGHIPEWLNLKHPKINWVKHSDFIPARYLPTFNINTIELNLHRIESLSEHFIYFNDDIFVLNYLEETRYFRNGLPCDSAIMTAKSASGGIIHMAINNLGIIDANFNKHKQIKMHPSKWFNLKYGKGLINNILLYPWREFSGFVDPHLPNAFLKSTFSEVWQQATDALEKTCSSKLRSDSNVNQWLIRYWQLSEGKFTPYNTKKGSLNIDINDDSISDICHSISSQKYDLICINDSDNIPDFEGYKRRLTESFEKILPKSSKFEID